MYTKKIISCCAVLASSTVVFAATYHVAPDAASGKDGLSWDTAMTIHEAVGKAAAGDLVLCKAGVYRPEVRIQVSRAITLKGGLAGTDDTTLAQSGERSIFDGSGIASHAQVLRVDTQSGAATTNIFEGIEIRNANKRGVYKTGQASLVFRNCAFTACGASLPYDDLYDNHELRGGAGCFLGEALGSVNKSAATLVFESCVFSGNVIRSGVGTNVGFGMAAAFKNWARVYIDDTLFVSNGLDNAYGFPKTGYGLNDFRGAAIYTEAPLTVRNAQFRSNVAGITAAQGGIVYIKYCQADSSFTNCLFAANSCEYCSLSTAESKEGGSLVFRTKTNDKLDVINCTFAYNLTDGIKVSAGIDVGGGTATVANTIFYGAQKGSRLACGRDIHVSSGATANVDYCLFEENSSSCFTADGTLNMGTHNVFGDPRFATSLTQGQLQALMVVSGVYTGYSATAFDAVLSTVDVHAFNRSLTVDTGDPASPYVNEPMPNGHCVNLGFYGNTSETLCSAGGMGIIIR